MNQERNTSTEIKPEQNILALASQYFHSSKFLSFKPKTQEFYIQSLNHFLDFAETNSMQNIDQISPDEIKNYIESNNKTKTIYRRIAAISGFFIWALKLDSTNFDKNPFCQITLDRKDGSNQVIFSKYPIRNLKEPKLRVRFLESEL